MRIEHTTGDKPAGWVRRHVFWLIIVPCCLVIAGAGVICWLVLADAGRTVAEDAPEVEPAPAPVEKYFSHLSGLPVASAADLTDPATCAMIENSPTARPQSGLRAAGVIYEAVAEGGITRFMAVYQEDEVPSLLGPVRSLRMHYAQWAKKYNCAIAHWGGADDALNLVRNSAGYRDADQFFNPSAYWRLAGRAAPHNGYTNAERQKALNAARGYGASEFAGFARAVAGELPTRAEVAATTINIPMSSAQFNVNYTYEPVSGTYLRAHASGGAHMDVDVDGVRVQNAPRVVVAMMVADEARPYSPYRNVVAIGSGVAHVFQNGEYIAGSWRKDSVDSELRFLDAAGEEIVLVPGQVWISASPNGKTVSWQ